MAAGAHLADDHGVPSEPGPDPTAPMEDEPAKRRWAPDADTLGVAAMAAAAGGIYTVFEVEQQRHFFTAGYDLGIFDQAIRGYAHLHAPVSLMKGVHNHFGTHFSVLGDHFSPILALLGPVYRVWPHAVTLLIVQGLLFAASVPSVFVFTRRKLGRVAAYVLALAYILSWGLQAAMAADFHEVALAVPLIAIVIDRFDSERLRSALIAAGLLLLVKEDYGLVVAALGLVIGIRTRRWMLAFAVAAVGLVATVLSYQVFIPAAGGKSGYYWDYYAALGPGPLSALWHVVRHPLSTLHLATTPHDKSRLLEWLFAPLGFWSLGSPYVLLAVPLLVERLVSSNPNHWTLTHQYSAPLVPILFMAAIDFAAKLRRAVEGARAIGNHRRARTTPAAAVTLAYCAGVLAIAVWACTRMPFDQLTKRWEWQTSSYERAEQAAVDAVPNGATVEVSNWLAPHLVDRANVMLLDLTPHDASWVVFDEGRIEFPFATSQQQQDRVAWLTVHGYHQVFSRAQIVVYNRR